MAKITLTRPARSSEIIGEAIQMSTLDQRNNPNAEGASGEWEIEKLDVDAYLARVGYDGDLRADVDTLFALHRAHAARIPFENLDVVLGRGISLDIKKIQDKLVRHERGGYCFEHNLLFAALLERIGFRVRRLAARVQPARTHMLLVVEADGREWLADVGFGATLLEPIPFEDGAVSRQGGWTYGLAKHGDGSWRLRSPDADGWTDLYTFTEEPQRFIDYVVYNHYTATHPDSPFVSQPRAVRVKPDVRYTLGGSTFISKFPEGSLEKRDLPKDEAIEALRDTFGIVLAPEDEARLREIFAMEKADIPDKTRRS